METLFTDTVANVNKERLDPDFAGRGGDPGFQGRFCGDRGGSQVTCGSYTCDAGKGASPEGSVAQKCPLPRGRRGCKEGILTFFWAGVEASLAFSGERWGSSGDQRLHTVHIEHAGEIWGPPERPCPLGSPLSGLVRTRVCNPRPFGRQAIWAKDPSGAVSFPAAYVYDLHVTYEPPQPPQNLP
jgi:hypothetical protein